MAGQAAKPSARGGSHLGVNVASLSVHGENLDVVGPVLLLTFTRA